MLAAEQPEWIDRLPFTEDAFWGVGEGVDEDEAVRRASQEILMQLGSRVKAVVTQEVSETQRTVGESTADTEYQRRIREEENVEEQMDSYFANNRLRGAEIVERYREDGRIWVLVSYCAECGASVMNSALNRFEEALGYDSDAASKQLDDSNLSRALIVDQRLREMRSEDFNSDDIIVRYRDRSVVISVINFVPFETDLSASQRSGLEALSSTLFQELSELGYTRVDVVGHANPTGDVGEEVELVELSRSRAETMTSYLRSAGFRIDQTQWRGGDETIGDSDTESGRGRNRRVEIVVSFE